LPQGGDQPNQTTIDNGIASHGIPAIHSVRHLQNHRTICAEPAVRFPPFQLYEFAEIRSGGGTRLVARTARLRCSAFTIGRARPACRVDSSRAPASSGHGWHTGDSSAV
jgi:hypothetical protein